MSFKFAAADITPISLEEVLGCRSYSADELMVKVAVAQIDPKQASEILQDFATLIPLQQYNLDHMKRVRRSLTDRNILEILICPERCIDDIPITLRNKCLPDTLRITTVPKLKPITRTEYEDWGQGWPTMFRPNAVDKEREKGFTKIEMSMHSYFMSLVDRDVKEMSLHLAGLTDDDGSHSHLYGGGVIVNPVNAAVRLRSNACNYMHLCIDYVRIE